MAKVSIIICTCNRAESLAETLAAIGRIDVPADLPAELVVVDNASTDDTKRIVGQEALPNMPVRLVHESRRGKGYAYNTGMAEARGEIFLFTDDDVRPPVNWIEGMCRQIVDGEADAVAGGVVFPAELDGQISMFREWFASTENLDPQRPSRLVGANMAFARSVLHRIPQFDTQLGPGQLGFFDETLFSMQLIAAGFRVVGALNIAVEHHLDASRLSAAAILDSARKMGRSHAYVFHHWEHRSSRLAWPRLILTEALLLWLTLRRTIGLSNPDEELMQRAYLEQRRSFAQQYFIERKCPRRYVPQGLGEPG